MKARPGRVFLDAIILFSAAKVNGAVRFGTAVNGVEVHSPRSLAEILRVKA